MRRAVLRRFAANVDAGRFVSPPHEVSASDEVVKHLVDALDKRDGTGD